MIWTKEMKMDILTYIIVGIVFFIIDVQTFEYKKSVYPLLLLHHIVNIFAQFLSRDKNVLLFYIFVPILVIFHWVTYKNKCILTEMVNRQCGIHERFHDIWYLVGAKNLKNYAEMHYVYLVVVWIIAVLRYIKMTRK